MYCGLGDIAAVARHSVVNLPVSVVSSLGEVLAYIYPVSRQPRSLPEASNSHSVGLQVAETSREWRPPLADLPSAHGRGRSVTILSPSQGWSWVSHRLRQGERPVGPVCCSSPWAPHRSCNAEIAPWEFFLGGTKLYLRVGASG
jgi:hypothetical protein